MTMNEFDAPEVIIDPQRVMRSQPFKHYLAGRKHDPNCYLTDTTDAAGVFITQQLKRPQLGRRVFDSY
jgi:hypothetical protein